MCMNQKKEETTEDRQWNIITLGKNATQQYNTNKVKPKQVYCLTGAVKGSFASREIREHQGLPMCLRVYELNTI